MKKIIISLLILASIISLYSCKKTPGCTDTAATNYNSDADDDDGSCTYLVAGESYQGGIIAYVLQSGDPGYVAGQTHGIIAATSDQSAGAEWGCAGITIGTSTAISSGQANTTAIINGCSEAGIAARLCNDLVLGGYSDWYLPSKNELNKLYINKAAIGGFSNSDYWSSSEEAVYGAWVQYFGSGNQNGDSKASSYRVRAVRAF